MTGWQIVLGATVILSTIIFLGFTVWTLWAHPVLPEGIPDRYRERPAKRARKSVKVEWLEDDLFPRLQSQGAFVELLSRLEKRQ